MIGDRFKQRFFFFLITINYVNNYKSILCNINTLPILSVAKNKMETFDFDDGCQLQCDCVR